MSTHPAQGPEEVSLAELSTQVSDLDDELTALTNQVAQLARAAAPGGQDPPAPAPDTARAWWWPDLDEATATAAWGKLGAWVRDKLLARHPHHGRTLRPCWRHHPEVVDELTALRLVWITAYDTPRPDPSSPADYLGRWLPQAITRIETAFTRAGCGITGGINIHQDNDQRWIPDPWNPDQVAAFITTDTKDRPATAD